MNVISGKSTKLIAEELLSLLEFRERGKKTIEDQLYEEAENLINFVQRTTRQYEFWTVGGHILILLQTPNGNLFPTGDFAKIKEGKIVKAGSFFVDNGKLMYKLGDGTVGEYRHLESISKDYSKKKTEILSELIL